MNSKTIRLTESQLHRVIKESLKKILRESVDRNLADAIEEILSENENEDIATVAEQLKSLGNLRFIDETIDDGIDDENCEDEYIIKRVYTLTAQDGNEYDIRLYYGNNTMELTYYTVS